MSRWELERGMEVNSEPSGLDWNGMREEKWQGVTLTALLNPGERRLRIFLFLLYMHVELHIDTQKSKCTDECIDDEYRSGFTHNHSFSDSPLTLSSFQSLISPLGFLVTLYKNRWLHVWFQFRNPQPKTTNAVFFLHTQRHNWTHLSSHSFRFSAAAENSSRYSRFQKTQKPRTDPPRKPQRFDPLPSGFHQFHFYW